MIVYVSISKHELLRELRLHPWCEAFHLVSGEVVGCVARENVHIRYFAVAPPLN